MTRTLTPELAERFAAIALGHVERDYPFKLDQVLAGPEDVQTPSKLHPIFHGSFDWHSCVHGHWLLARVLGRYPECSSAGAIAALFDRQFTPEKVAGELAYLARPFTGGFERPYGWAWLLALQAELAGHDRPDWRRWAATLRPLAEAFAERLHSYLPKLTYPLRAGTHGNTAFALALAADYARAAGDVALMDLMRERAMGWFAGDRDAQAWEPSGDDFLSPTLMAAACLRRLMHPPAFAAWFEAYLPGVAHGQPASLFTPAVVSDPTDGKIAHLDGLNLSRAWCWRSLAGTLERGDPRREAMLAAADRHIDASLPAVSGDYMGEHWLASFAVLALESGRSTPPET